MKTFYTISVFVIFFTHWHVSVSAQTTVNFPDANLAASVRTALGLAEGADIPRTSLQGLRDLYAASAAITDITGLEEASGLQSLNLDGNQIRDITPLRDLTALTELQMQDNPISDFTPLRSFDKPTAISPFRN